MKDNIVKNPSRRYPVTFVTVVFALILVYFAAQGVILMRKSSISAYNIGAAESDSVYGTRQGILLRNEQVFTSPMAGYVTYYTIPGERIKKDKLCCTVDSDGELEEKLHKLYYGQEILKPESRIKVQNMIRTAAASYDPLDFKSAARAKTEIRSMVFHALLQDGGEEALLQDDTGYTPVEAEASGFTLFSLDGYEALTPETLDSSLFDRNACTEIRRYNGDHVAAGDFIYKLVEDNRFTLVFLLTDEDRSRYASKTKLTVRFEDDRALSGDFSVGMTTDGLEIGIVSFAKYGGNYLEYRFVPFQIIDSDVTGFKIPETAITTKSFFAVDSDYITESGTGSQKGVLRKEGDDKVFVSCTVYQGRPDESGEEGFIIGSDTSYIYSDSLLPGDIIIAEKPDPVTGLPMPTETVLGVTASVEGVYQINQGYCIFKPIVRLNDSLETSYVMISPTARYSLKPYDRIVLDASDVHENELIFE